MIDDGDANGDDGFRRGGLMKGGAPVGVRGYPPLKNFEISSPRKRDFCHSEAKSACFSI